MVAIGRALMSNPRLLLCDEISLGLAPIVIRDIYDAMPRIKQNGTSIVLVEQDIAQAMKVADRVYCFQEGRVSLSGRPAELTREQVHARLFWTLSMIDWLGTIIQGVLLGGLYALFAAGLSLIFGIMRLVNLAHGDLIVLAAFADTRAGDRGSASILSSRVLLAHAGDVRRSALPCSMCC